ncbi:MAG: hypothetical protein B6227_02085 [Fusobacteriia bacterium 4572_74]|nr:MAG: hypothetical protein B6227_02085 [Fusobacteriia bacterium 4572_74]
MKKSKGKLFLILPILMITMVSTTIIRKIKNTPPKISSEKLNQRVPIEVFEVKKKTLIKSLDYTGLVKLDKEIIVSPRVKGLISKIYVDEGDRVKKGDLLVTLDPEDYQIKFNISQNEKKDAEIKVEQAKLNLEDTKNKIKISSLNLKNLIVKKKELHYKDLEEKSTFETQKANYYRDKTLWQVETQEESINIDVERSKLELDQSKLQNKLAQKNLNQVQTYLKTALNNLNNSKNQLEYTKIKAKEDGIILNIFSESGEVASLGQKLVKLGVDDIVKITLGVGNKDLPYIVEGMGTKISIDSIPGEVYKGKINKIMPSVSDSGLTLIEVNLDNNKHFFTEDMFARIKLVVDKAERVLVVPKEFININNNNNKYLYVVKNETVLKTIVKTGIESDAMIEISSGINENDLVASGNLSHLKDGNKVLIWNNIWNDIKGGEGNDIN